MLDPRWIIENENVLREKLRLRNYSESYVDQILESDVARRALMKEIETLRAKRNSLSKEVGEKKRKKEDASSLMEEAQKVNDRIAAIEGSLEDSQKKVTELLYSIPNALDDSVPPGKDEKENKKIREWGEPKKFSFTPKDHHELGVNAGIIDFDRATRMASTRFSALIGKGARLERALINFMLDLHSTKHGYKEMIPPFLVNSNALIGTGQLPKFREDLFKIDGLDLYLIPTAEVPVTNFYREEILEESALPIKFAAYTPCFRSEAGSYGKDTRGLIRQHQFDKVELVIVCRPEESWDLHEALTAHAEEVLKQLGLPYRTMLLCAGDTGFNSAKTYDIEVWLPGQSAYREISSCSNYLDYQARREGMRFREKGGKPQLAHTINGSALAVGRTLLAILENYQQEDGSILIPDVLQKYTGFDRIEASGK